MKRYIDNATKERKVRMNLTLTVPPGTPMPSKEEFLLAVEAAGGEVNADLDADITVDGNGSPY